jgi:hypothetical protein
MARIAVLDDYEDHAMIFSAPLKLAGHETLEEVTPIDWERVVQFRPEVVCIVMYRNRVAFNRPIDNPATDILGYEAIEAVEQYPAIQVVPILLVGNAVEEADIPSNINYDLFLTFPEDISLYLPKLVELAMKVKTRRKISRYHCPQCSSRLVAHKMPARDLFCPRCHTAITIIDDIDCLMMVDGDGFSIPCKVSDLNPRDPLSGHATPI